MELLKSVKRRTLLGEIGYYGLNIGLVVVLFVMSQTIQYPVAALVLVLLSKWRMLAVRPRFWMTNIQSNMVDVIVGVSIVTLMYAPHITAQEHMATWMQAGLAVFYAAWLVIIKPMSKRWQMMAQSGLATFFGTTALFAVSYEWPAAIVVALAAIIGYSVARHFFLAHDDDQTTFFSLVWAAIIAEVSWLVHYWTFSYSLFGVSALRIPQGAIIIMLLSFVAERVYRSWRKRGAVVAADVAGPAVMAAVLIVVMLVLYNEVVLGV